MNGSENVLHWRLSNGMEVLLWPDNSRPMTAVHSWFRVGSVHEKEGKSGIAHLLEHLMFKGTKAHPKGEFDRILEGRGAASNAATWVDWTYYHETVPPDALELVLGLEFDRLTDFVLTEADFRSELDVVINERANRVDNSVAGQLDEILNEMMFEGHGYAHPTVGYLADLEQLILPDVEAFRAAHYSPENLVLVAVGAMDPGRIRAVIERTYGDIPRRAPAGSRAGGPGSPRLRAGGNFKIAGAIAQEKLMIGYGAPANRDPDYTAMEVLAYALAGSESSRLHHRLVVEAELAQEISMFVLPFKEAGGCIVSLAARETGTLEKLRDAYHRELGLIGGDALGEEAVQRARVALKAKQIRALKTADERAAALGFCHVTLGDYHEVFRAIDHINAVSRDQVMDVFHRYFMSGNSCEAAGIPAGSGVE